MKSSILNPFNVGIAPSVIRVLSHQYVRNSSWFDRGSAPLVIYRLGYHCLFNVGSASLVIYRLGYHCLFNVGSAPLVIYRLGYHCLFNVGSAPMVIYHLGHHRFRNSSWFDRGSFRLQGCVSIGVRSGVRSFSSAYYPSDFEVVTLVLPNIDNKEDFLSELRVKLSCLDKFKYYKLEFCLYLNTNDQAKVFVSAPKEDSVLSSNKYEDHIMGYLVGLMILENTYKYRGFYPSYIDSNFSTLDLDLNLYLINMYDKLSKYIVYTNETLEIDEFVEFKKSSILKITTLKSNNFDGVKLDRSLSFNGKRLYSTKSNLIDLTNSSFTLAPGQPGVGQEINNYINNNKNSLGKKGVWKSNKIKYLHFNVENFTLVNLLNEIVSNFKLNTTYSLLVKFSFHGNKTFYMGGKQYPIVVGKTHDEILYKHYYEYVVDLYKETLMIYNVSSHVNGIQIMYVVMVDQPELKLKNIKHLSINKKLVNLTQLNRFNSTYIPLILDESFYGNSLISNKLNDFVLRVNKIALTNKFDSNNFDSIYLNNKYVIASKKVSSSVIKRFVYNYFLGNFIQEVTDFIELDGFTRQINNISVKIKQGEVVSLSISYQLDCLKSPYLKPSVMSLNSNIGSFDLETYVDIDGLSKVYALGFVVFNEKKSYKYKLTDFNYNSSLLVVSCIDNMLINKYHNYIFYTHNFGKFDVVFLIKILEQANIDKGFEYYKLDITARDDLILRLSIRVKINSKVIKISIVDSINLMSGSLDNISKDFGTKNQKGVFPHKFVTRNTLNYIGNTPDKIFYNISDLEYKQLITKNWDLKQEVLDYLDKDLFSLLNIMEEFNSYIYNNYAIQMTECLTISRLSVNLFLKHYLKGSKIPLINKFQMFDFIEKGYYGGVTEVYIPYGKNLNYYDVNSLYPYASLNPIPGNNSQYIEDFSGNGLNLDELFGFFYCKIKTALRGNNYLGLLPLHHNGSLICPNGEYYGTWSSEELKFAKNNGYTIHVIKGYKFNKIYNVFDGFVKDLYKTKSENFGSIKSISKSLLNNPIGRLGMNIIKPVTKLINKEELNYILSTREVYNLKTISENCFLIMFSKLPSEEICLGNSLDYNEVLNKNLNKDKDNENPSKFKDVSISTAAMILSYSRIYMSKIKLDIKNKGGNIYYTDTDSIVTDIELSEHLVGKDLGQFKLEYKIKEAYFISNKTYCLILKQPIKNKNTGLLEYVVIKSKGVYSSSLSVGDFMDMYYLNKNIKAIKGDTKTDYSQGSVTIGNKEAILHSDAYIKREKIYNDMGLWLDTKPLFKQDSTCLVKYENNFSLIVGLNVDFISINDDFILINYS